MSDSAQPPQRETSQSATVPKAIVHKKILDAAEAEPDASIEKLADTVNGVSVDLVEQVLDEYGDPVEEEDNQSATEDESNTLEVQTQPVSDSNSISEESKTQQVTTDDQEELSEKQQETLRAIHENPEATQKKLAEKFDVSSATICQRVNDVDGFEWENRHDFVSQMFENGKSPAKEQMTSSQTEQELSAQIEKLHQRIQTLEQNIEEESSSPTVFANPDLIHKVIHACIHSDQITEEEELLILRKVIGYESKQRDMT